MQVIVTDKAPGAIGPYSQAVRSGELLFCSGQIGIDPATGMLAGEDIASQTLQVLVNLREVLKVQGLDLCDVIKTTVFLADLSELSQVNSIYGGEFGEHKPARSTVQVAGLPRGALIEIECIAAVRGAKAESTELRA